MLKQLDEFKDVKVVRTRDQSIIEGGDIVVDVGGVYGISGCLCIHYLDASKNRFDHHQRGFSETFGPNYPIKLSSAGLVYKHFGKRVIEKLLGWPDNAKDLDYVYQQVYGEIIEAFDGVDNGVPKYPQDIKAAYHDRSSISARVARLNPRWNQETNDQILYDQFLKAVEITGAELVAAVENIALSSIPARDIALDGFQTRFNIHPSGKIIVLSQYCPFKSIFFDMEKELNLAAEDLPLYVLFQDTSNAWR